MSEDFDTENETPATEQEWQFLYYNWTRSYGVWLKQYVNLSRKLSIATISDRPGNPHLTLFLWNVLSLPNVGVPISPNGDSRDF
jgi:hypothetical protein